MEGKVGLVANFSDQAVEKGVRAGDLMREIAPAVGGKGGGRANMARGGGTDASGVEAALTGASEWLRERLA